MLPVIPSDKYKLFPYDIVRRKRHYVRYQEEYRNSPREGKAVELYMENWGDVKSEKDQRDITSEVLRTLCPVTWKTLDLAFKHGVLESVISRLEDEEKKLSGE